MPNRKFSRPIIHDITRGHYKEVVNLRPTTKKHLFLGTALFLFGIITISVFLYIKNSRAQLVNFYPSSCLGNWQNSIGAAGLPQLEKDAIFSDYNIDNSALYDGGDKQIFCGNFSGEIPNDASIQDVQITLHWVQSRKRIIILSSPEGNVVDQVLSSPSTTTTSTESSSPVFSIEDTVTSTTEPVSPVDIVVPNNIPADITPTEPASSTVSVNSSISTTVSQSSSWLQKFISVANAQITSSTGSNTVPTLINVTTTVIAASTASAILDSTTTEASFSKTTFIDTGYDISTDSNSQTTSPGELFRIRYSLDGLFWQTLGITSMDNWQSKFIIPLVNVSDISKLQISVESLSEAADNTIVWLDAMELNISYDLGDVLQTDLLSLNIDDKTFDNSDENLIIKTDQSYNLSIESPTDLILSDIQADTLVASNKHIRFTNTDDNSNENLIIKTDKKTYVGLAKAEVYFSVANTGNKPELTNFQFYFPKDQGEVKKIEKWTTNIPYVVDIPEYGSKEYKCKDGWQITQDAYIEEPIIFYQCRSTNESMFCGSLSVDGKNCILNQVEVGSHKEIKYKDEWQETILSNKSIKVEKTIQKKSIANKFKVKKSTFQNYLINPGQTEYFRVEIFFPPESSGEFYIEAVGDKEGYGLLDPWWSSSWDYKKQITLSPGTGAGTNYQVKLLVGESSGSSGANFNLAGHATSTFGDLRFVNSSESTELDYWIQSVSGTTPNQTATVWVEVQDDLSSATTTIYAYYGNASATHDNSSGGNDTFLFFDDFSGDLSKWTIDPANTDKVSISSGTLRHDPDTTQSRNSYFDTRLRTTNYKITNGIIEYSVYLAGTSASTPRIIHQLGWRVNSNDFTNGYNWRVQNSSSDGGHLRFSSGSWSPFGTAFNAITGNTWHTVKEIVNGTNFIGSVDGGSNYSGTDSTKQTEDYLISHVHGVSLGASSYVLVDNIRVRKYASTEPAFSSVGSEQTKPISNQNHFRWRNDIYGLNTNNGWLANEDTAYTTLAKGDTIRLRQEIANTGGSTADGYQYRLEYATRTDSTCGDESFIAVPATATTEHFEMVSSTQYIDDDSITTGYLTAVGTRADGKGVEDPSNQTASYNLTNAYFTEFEYAIKATTNATDSGNYCFRLTNNGSSTDFIYSIYPQVTVTSNGSLSADIVDSGGSPVASPFVPFATTTVSYSCNANNATFGTTTQKIRVDNTTGAPQWTMTIAASSTSAVWQGANYFYDFNDSGGSPNGCTDSGDSDGLAGMLQFDPSVGTITPEGGCSTTGLSLGNAAYFVEGSTDTITLVTAGGTAQTSCYWDFTGIDTTQRIPAEQPADNYNIELIITVTAS